MGDFQENLQDIQSEEISVIAGSIDPADKTQELVDKLGLTYPVAIDMDSEETSRVTGAFYESERKFIQPTAFIVRPDKSIEVASYSTGPVGRFVAKNVLNLIKFYKSKMKKRAE